MTATFLTDLSTLSANSPVSLIGGVLVGTCSALFLVTRLPEFLVMTVTAACYGVAAALPFVHG